MELKSSDLDRRDLFPLPGCRFSPTDVELVAYHLLRKARKRKLPVELIAEVDVYKFAPWELADKSILKGDLIWYFFCPIEKKYLSGIRKNRANDFGHWKITGNERQVLHNDALVGSKKTLIFYKGKAPGERTDWVMHEYRLDDKYRAERGVAQNEHVLCKIVQKEGLGPRQYGSPFKEEDWNDDNYPKKEDRNDDEKVSFGLFTPTFQCDGTASEPYSSESVLSQHVVLPAVQSTNVIPKAQHQVFGGHDVSFSSSVVSNEDENDETLYTRDFKVMELKSSNLDWKDLFPLPGLQFSPTDDELVVYHLLGKATKRKFPVELIAEVDVYKFAPWKLADESIVKGGLIWYFFCPIDKKYSSGIRTNHATDVGYWKVTGKERSVLHNNALVGSKKTLVFYKGRAPKGERMDWVMHEYRLDDKYRAERGVAQNEYVLCKIVQKEGLGPRQYRSPFKEEDWNDDNYPKKEDWNNDKEVSFNLFTPTLQCDGTASEPYSSKSVPSQHVVLPAVQSTNVIPKQLHQVFGGHDVSFSTSVVSNEDENDEDSFHLSSLTQMVDHGQEDTSMCSLNDIWSVQIEETSMPNKQLQEEKCEKEMASEPHGMTIDVEAFNMTDSSEASETRQPEDIQVGEMQPQAVSALKSQGVVFDVEVVNILKPGGQVESHIEDIEIEPESSEQLFLMQCGLGLTKLPKDEDWMNAKEIYLMDNELSVLPENPRCSSLLALFLSRNYKLRMIPPSFFDHMPALQILNLSKTGIKSLPDSLFRLVSLKRLFLNDCHRLMMLSPQVADLKQLEVLDLEGAKIMDLPKEIKKLTNLTCLEVSFYGYTSNGWRAMQSNFMVPCGVISSLSHLEELNIDVNPDDERWDVRVKDIVDEICSLKRLETLKFYFPRVELLRHFQWNSPLLSHFRFTVGRHVKRIMSRVPPDVEFELEQWERYLKYINGVGVPRDIKNVLQHVTAFFLDRHATVKKLSDFGTRNMKQLKSCVIGECNEVQVIIDAADAYGQDGINEIVSESYDAERIVLGSLEYLYIYYMKNLRSIWEGSIQQNSLFLLKSLTLRTCPQLTTIFTQGLLDNLRNLEELKVEDCPSINSIVCCNISSEYKSSSFLPNLKKISLHYMPGLVSISGGLHIAPKLEWLSFYNCPNLKNPLIHEVYCQDLKKIKGERCWWEALEWSNGCPDYLEEIFVSIDI